MSTNILPTIVNFLGNNPAVIILLIYLFGYVVWKIAAWKTGVDSKLFHHEGKLTYLDDVVKDIHQVIMQRDGGRPVILSDSPLKLSDYGIELAEKIAADEIVARYTMQMHNATRGMNAYQIQEYCADFCRDKLPADLENNYPDMFATLSDVAFNEGIVMEKLTQVIGIKLRDKMLFKYQPAVLPAEKLCVAE